MVGRIVVETERLLIREFTENDVTEYYVLGNNASVTHYTGTGRFASLEHAMQILRANPLTDYQQHGFGWWACVLKESGEVIGFRKATAILSETEANECARSLDDSSQPACIPRSHWCFKQGVKKWGDE